jgi:hypothetical protein
MFAATLRRLLAATSAAAILTAVTLLVADRFDAANPFDASSAAARNGGDNSGSGGGGSDDSGSGGGNSGHGGGDDDGDDNSGRGGGDDDEGDSGENSGPGGGDDDDRYENDFGYPDGHYVDGDTGARIEVDGGKIKIVYPDGWKEELENGIFELKDPSGRTVIERRATGEDVARLRAIVN